MTEDHEVLELLQRLRRELTNLRIENEDLKGDVARLREALRWARDRVCERHDGLDLSLIDAALAGEGP